MARYKVLAAGIFNLILALGIARFAYTPLLPLMQKQAGLGVAEAGWLAAINYVGYLAGALAASLIADTRLKDRLYRASMLAAVITTAMMGAGTDPWLWAASRFLAGLASAGGMLLGTALIMSWLLRHDHRPELGIHFSGLGLGVAVGAAAIEAMNRFDIGWSAQWYILTALGCVLLVPALAWLPGPDPADASARTQSGRAMTDAPPPAAFLRLFLAMYFCAGVGYVVSATFIVAIVDQIPGLAGRGTLVFLFVGLGGVPSSILWDLAARRMGDIPALILACILQIAGILLPAVSDGLIVSLIGALLFGATVTGIVSLVLTMAGRYYPTHPAKMMGRLTLGYGVAQVVAPAITGSLAAALGSYRVGFYLAAAAMALAAVLLVAMRATEMRARAVAQVEADPA